MKIKNIRLSSLTNDLHVQCIIEIRDLIRNHDAKRLSINPLFEDFTTFYDQEDECYKLILKSDFTEKKAQKDHARDELLIGLRKIIKSAFYDFEPEMIEAAKRLSILFTTYDKIEDLPYDAETAAITNLLQELNGTYAGDVKTLDIRRWITKLEQENEDFESLVKATNDEKSSKTVFKMKQIRRGIDNVYHAIIESINARILIEGEAEYHSFASKINTLADHYNNIAAQRKGRNAAKKS